MPLTPRKLLTVGADWAGTLARLLHRRRKRIKSMVYRTTATTAIFCLQSVIAVADTMPKELIGSWCSINSEYARIDVSQKGFEEGDSACDILGLQKESSAGLVTYAIAFSCDPGVERQQRRSKVERFNVLFDAKTAHLYRRGGASNIYRKCKR